MEIVYIIYDTHLNEVPQEGNKFIAIFQIRLCQFHSYRHFFSQYPSSSTRSKLLGSSRYSLNYQNHLGSKFTSLASNSATNQF